MKEVIALLWGICIVVVTIYLVVNNNVSKTAAGMFFAVAILGGLVIANYDVLKKVSGLGLEVETFRKEIDSVKEEALAEIKQEVAEHKESIALLVRTGNDLSTKLEDQKADVTAIIEKAQALETQLTEQEKQLEETQSAVGQVAKLAESPTLTLTGRDILQTDSGYTATLQFTSSKNVPLGQITFIASLIRSPSVTITDFWPSLKGGAFQPGDQSKKINPDGRQATLHYSLFTFGKPTVDLKVTAACELKIESNYLTDPITIRIE